VTPELIVVATLRESGRATPAPGDSFTLGVMRYDVEAVLSGDYPHRDLYVADESANAYTPGDRHRLELTRELPDEATLLSEYDTRGLGVYYCLGRQPAL
jgi:hypothetical protein